MIKCVVFYCKKQSKKNLTEINVEPFVENKPYNGVKNGQCLITISMNEKHSTIRVGKEHQQSTTHHKQWSWERRIIYAMEEIKQSIL